MTARRPAIPPPETWPPRMQAELAAAYCGEKSIDEFLRRVGKDYPLPRQVDSRRRKFWYRTDLDKALGLGEAPVEDMGDEFRAAWEKRRRGAA
jgi:hypothetical protein